MQRPLNDQESLGQQPVRDSAGEERLPDFEPNCFERALFFLALEHAAEARDLDDLDDLDNDDSELEREHPYVTQ